uniref:Uncharacterized protein n=1 Tax=Nelumbo nucifera TaxID=4432 RepID=A0A822YWR2_NELNU|nr:TPA_asm: hypothetical protein HUJ06_007773 [Nelumbo nucifera]
MDFEGILESAHCLDEIVPCLAILVGVEAEDFIADKEVTNQGFGVERNDIGSNPFVCEGLARRNVGD